MPDIHVDCNRLSSPLKRYLMFGLARSRDITKIFRSLPEPTSFLRELLCVPMNGSDFIKVANTSTYHTIVGDLTVFGASMITVCKFCECEFHLSVLPIAYTARAGDKLSIRLVVSVTVTDLSQGCCSYCESDHRRADSGSS
jgi:hypothetical protein